MPVQGNPGLLYMVNYIYQAYTEKSKIELSFSQTED